MITGLQTGSSLNEHRAALEISNCTRHLFVLGLKVPIAPLVCAEHNFGLVLQAGQPSRNIAHRIEDRPASGYSSDVFPARWKALAAKSVAVLEGDVVVDACAYALLGDTGCFN